jgi:hypothetical protein
MPNWQVGDEVQFGGRRYQRLHDNYWHDFENADEGRSDAAINAEFKAGRALICIKDGMSESDFRLWETQPGEPQ